MKRNKLRHIKPSANSFKIPEGYFDTIEDAVFSKLSAEKLSDTEGFSTPDSYFENVENNILEKIQKEKSQQAKLPSSKKAGFILPENYLKSVEGTISDKLKDDTKQVKVVNFRTTLIKRIIPFAVAASLLLFVILNYNSKTTSFDTVAATEIEQWIEDDLITFETAEIAEVYNDTELENQVFSSEDENELVDYLNGTDIESLLFEN